MTAQPDTAQPARPSGTWVETDLGRLFVESAGAGPAIVCWPHLFFGSITLRPQFDEFSRDHRVLLIDPPGHGRSDAPRRPFTREDCAKAAMRVLDDAGIERAVLLGSSWGGPVCVTAALLFPDRVRGFVAMNGPMYPFSTALRLQFRLMIPLYVRFGPLDAWVREMTRRQISKQVRTTHPEREAAIADRLRSADRRGLELAMRSVLLSREPSLALRLGEVRVPSLFVTGACDTLIKVDDARTAASAVKGSRFEVVEGSSHQSGLEAPERVNPWIADFLRTLEGAG